MTPSRPGTPPAAGYVPSEGELWQTTVFPVSYLNGSGVITAAPCYLTGWCFLDASGTSSSISYLYGSTDGSGQLVAPIMCPGAGSNVVAFPPPWIPCPNGLYFHLQLNEPIGAVYVILRPGGLD